MLDSLDAALTFALLVVPGYQLVRGYAVVRGAGPPDRDLYVVAQAVVASLAWLAVTWPAVQALVRWIVDDEVSDHAVAAIGVAPLVVGVPHLIGRAAGALVGLITRIGRPWGPRWLAVTIKVVGLTGQPSTWDRTWSKLMQGGGGLVTLALDDNHSIVGQFGPDSFVATSPAPPAVYFERAYEISESGRVIRYPGGAYVDGARIVAVRMGVSHG